MTLAVFGVGIISTHSALAAAWQASASISGNNVTTAPLITVTTEQVVTASDLATNLGEVVADPTSWFFFNDENSTIDNSLGSFVVGPGTPLIGTGGVQISVTGTQRRNLATYQFAGVKLADIRTLAFTTYNPSLGNGGSVNRSAYLQFNVTFTGADTWQRRLIFVPANNGTVVQNTWQEWDAINNGNALWGWSGFAANGNQWPDGNTTELRTWQSLLVAFPQIAIRTTDSWLGLRVGEPYPDGYTENIDSFTIGVINGFTQNVVTYDFEPTSPLYTGTGLGEQGTSATASSDNSDTLPPEETDEESNPETNSSPSTDPALDPENTDTNTSTSHNTADEMTSGENDEDQTTSNSNSPAEPAGGDENTPDETTGGDTGDNTAASADTDNADALAETESGSTDSLESSAPAVTE